jgi:hypothetical protein
VSSYDAPRYTGPAFTHPPGSIHSLEYVPDRDFAVKKDDGKVPLDLIDPTFLTAVGTILGFGAKKYAPNNWRKGMAYSRVYAAVLRHLNAWWARDNNDAESGFSHLSHAACGLMFLIAFAGDAKYMQWDDRP